VGIAGLALCDSNQHTDLLWASKGGGGGNFGVTTSFTLRTRQLSSLVVFFLQWPWSSASRVIGAWQSWAPDGPHDALWDIQYSTSWNEGATSGVANAHAWLRAAYADLHPHANGQAYQNYIDPDLTNWQQAYYAGNYPRLARIKHRYDPANLFNFPQSITG
jgi:FAD/FMN-containing dehydrogenase